MNPLINLTLNRSRIKRLIKVNVIVSGHLKLKERKVDVPLKQLDLFYKRLLLNIRSDLKELNIHPLDTEYLAYARSYLATHHPWAGNEFIFWKYLDC